MGEMNRERIIELIKADNPKARTDDCELYAAQFLTYCEAALNIARLGAIVAHPRTAAPMDNPYLRVRTGAMAAMQKLARLRKLDSLWNEFEKILQTQPTELPAEQPKPARKRR